MSHSIEAATLARLIETGVIRESKRNAKLIKRYETALWLERSSRKAEWIIREECQINLEQRLVELIPSWSEDFEYLRSLGLSPYNPDDIKSLVVLKQRSVSRKVINRRNWNAATGVGPKHKAKLQSESTITSDWTIRFRPNSGLLCVVDNKQIDLAELSNLYSECIIPERMWLRFEKFSGKLPDTLITCENLGAYVDLPVLSSTMVLYSPGRDTVVAVELLNRLPSVSWIHFGDIDPTGFQIAQQIANVTKRKLQFYIPSFAQDYLPGENLKGRWGGFEGHDHPIVYKLMKSNRGIFQEVFMLDSRLSEDLQIFSQSLL